MKESSVGKHSEKQCSPEAVTKGQGYERKVEQKGSAWNKRWMDAFEGDSDILGLLPDLLKTGVI